VGDSSKEAKRSIRRENGIWETQYPWGGTIIWKKSVKYGSEIKMLINRASSRSEEKLIRQKGGYLGWGVEGLEGRGVSFCGSK